MASICGDNEDKSGASRVVDEASEQSDEVEEDATQPEEADKEKKKRLDKEDRYYVYSCCTCGFDQTTEEEWKQFDILATTQNVAAKLYATSVHKRSQKRMLSAGRRR